MKTEFDIPEQIYKKFQAAMIITEEEESAVITRLISSFLAKRFGTEPDVEQMNEKIIAGQSVKRVSAYTQKKEFVEWFKLQTYRGRPYNPVTISGYSGRIENACQNPGFEDIEPKNLFEIDDVHQFRQVRESIEQSVGFEAVETATHNGFTAALNMYDRFLRRGENADEMRPVRTMVSREPHHWTYAEDELCCQIYFDTYVKNDSPMDLTSFSQLLHQKLPNISVGSLKMKAQNIKCLCGIYGINDSLIAKSLNQYSAQSRNAFESVKEKSGL